MLKTKAFKPGHVCEHVCDTFMGWFVRSRDVKSVPPSCAQQIKGWNGRKKEFLSSGDACRSCPNVAGVPPPLQAAELRGSLGCRPAPSEDFMSPVPPKASLKELRSALSGGRMGSKLVLSADGAIYQ